MDGTCTAEIDGWEDDDDFRTMASSGVDLLKENQEGETSGAEAPKS